MQKISKNFKKKKKIGFRLMKEYRSILYAVYTNLLVRIAFHIKN